MSSATVQVGNWEIPMSQVARIYKPVKLSEKYEVHTVSGDVYRDGGLTFCSVVPAQAGFEVLSEIEDLENPGGRPQFMRSEVIAWRVSETVGGPRSSFAEAITAEETQGDEKGIVWVHDRRSDRVWSPYVASFDTFDEFVEAAKTGDF